MCKSDFIVENWKRGRTELRIIGSTRFCVFSALSSYWQDIATSMSDFAVQKDEREVTVELTPQKYRGGERDLWVYSQSGEEFTLWVGFYGGSERIVGDFDFRFFLINFDDTGTVASYEQLSAKGRAATMFVAAPSSANYPLENAAAYRCIRVQRRN